MEKIQIKSEKLTHQDLGQMQMYVNYFDRYVKQDFEKPTIGILLCKEKNDALVELTLPKDANVYAAAYQLYLPDKALLQAKVKEWIEEFEENCLLKVDSKLNSLAKLQGQKLTILSTIRIWLLMFLARMVKFRFLLPAVLHHALYQKRWLSLKSAWILSKS